MDRAVAVVLFLTGLGVAWKSAELPIGFVPAEGPGGGFLPFWLSMGISACAVGVFVQSFFGEAPGHLAGEGAEEERFISWEGVTGILRVGVPALIMVLLTSTISIYFAAAAFVFYVLYYVGRHAFRVSLSVSIGVPIAIFFIFEKFLLIPLPTGYVEPLFYLEWGALF